MRYIKKNLYNNHIIVKQTLAYPGRLENGFLRVRCGGCQEEKLVVFSCKRRGFCPGCSARRVVDSTACLMDEILPDEPHRQWVLFAKYVMIFTA